VESKAKRKARLRLAAGSAIERAIASGADPFALMMQATGEGANICEPYVEQHPLFLQNRHLFKSAAELRRAREAAAIAAVIAAEPGSVVWVRRQFNNRKHAAYRLADVSKWHWSNFSGGIGRKANRHYLHGYVWCDAMLAGKLGHSCQHGPPPHHIKVCITKKGNEKVWRDIEAVAPMDKKPEPKVRRKRRGRKVRRRRKSKSP
jgi:hypothetical protein